MSDVPVVNGELTPARNDDMFHFYHNEEFQEVGWGGPDDLPCKEYTDD